RTDDLAPKDTGMPRASNSTASAPQSEPARVDSASHQRAAARAVFEAKFREPNPRMPFYVTLGILGVIAIGTIGYFWYQLPPRPPLVNTNPPRTASEPLAQAAVASPVLLPASEPPRPRAEIPGLPEVSAAGKAIGSPAASIPVTPDVELPPQPKTTAPRQARP